MVLPSHAHIHMIAVCGTAMGSLAGMLRESGYRITGSDYHVYPPMSTFLADLGIEVQEGFNANRLDPAPDLVVIGNAVSRGNPEVEAVLNRKIPYKSLPEVLRDFFIRGKRPIVVTGTHGKTTTTALIAHLLSHAGYDPSFMIAGLPHNFNRSYHLGSGEHFIVEGDEYDSAFFAKHAKFFYYLPEILVVNNIEFDHADIYDDLAAIEKAFRQLINTVPENGLLLAGHEDETVAGLLPASLAPVQTFGLDAQAHWHARDIEITPSGYRFAVYCEAKPWGIFELPLLGIYNIRNALAAIGAGAHAGLAATQLQEGLASFAGVHRRQEILGSPGGITLIDDFAHHPTAVGQTLESIRQAYPHRRLWALFEPASATNARATFTARYIEAFAAADLVVIAKVPRPERARQDEPFSAQCIIDKLQENNQTAWHIPEVAAIVDHLLSQVQPGDVVVFMSNGSFGGIQAQVLTALERTTG